MFNKIILLMFFLFIICSCNSKTDEKNTFNKGKKKGISIGEEKGYLKGYGKGYEEGTNDGYKEGYEKGFKSGEYSQKGNESGYLLESYTTTDGKYTLEVKGFYDEEPFGISLKYFGNRWLARDLEWDKEIDDPGFDMPTLSEKGDVAIPISKGYMFINSKGENIGEFSVNHSEIPYFSDLSADRNQCFSEDGKYLFTITYKLTKENDIESYIAKLICIDVTGKRIWEKELGEIERYIRIQTKNDIIIVESKEYGYYLYVYDINSNLIGEIELQNKSPRPIILNDKIITFDNEKVWSYNTKNNLQKIEMKYNEYIKLLDSNDREDLYFIIKVLKTNYKLINRSIQDRLKYILVNHFVNSGFKYRDYEKFYEDVLFLHSYID